MQKAVQGLQKAEQKFEKGIEKNVSKYGSKLDGQVQKAVNKARKPADDLASRISSGQAKIEAKAQEEKAKKRKRNIFQKAWDAATGWIKAFASWVADHWEIIAIIALAVIITVATLGVGAILAGSLSGIALIAATAATGAVFGAIQGGLTQLLKNHMAGKGWSMDGVWKEAAIGAVFGGISGGSGAALEARGASSLIRLGATEGIQATNTVVDNTLNGNSWSDGLALDLLAAGAGHYAGESLSDGAEALARTRGAHVHLATGLGGAPSAAIANTISNVDDAAKPSGKHHH